MYAMGWNVVWHLEFTTERGKAMHTFVYTVPNHWTMGESVQRRERLCVGPAIRLAERTRDKQTYIPASDF